MVRALVSLGVIGALAGTAAAQPVVAIVSAPPRPALEVPDGAPEPVVAAFELGQAARRFWQARVLARRSAAEPAPRWNALEEVHAAALARLDRARLDALESWLAGAGDPAASALVLAGRLRIDLAELEQAEASAPDYGPARQHLERALGVAGSGPLADAARIELASIAGNEQRRISLLQQVACPAPSTPDRYEGCPSPAAEQRPQQYAWATLASLHLENDEPALAIAAAQRLAPLEGSPYRPAALYFGAWASYRLQDYQAALAGFDRITREPELASLAPEAWQYIALILYELPDGLDRAEAMFRTDTRAPARQVLLELAGMYRADERPAQAIRALRLALDGWPEHPGVPRTAHQLVTLDVEVNGNAHGAVLAVTLVERLLRGGAWHQANAGNPEVLGQRDRFVETVLLFVGDFFLTLAEDPKHKMPVPTAQRAGEAFALLLREVPDSPELMRATFGRGRALELQGQLGEAKAEYQLVRERAADPALRAAANERLEAMAQNR